MATVRVKSGRRHALNDTIHITWLGGIVADDVADAATETDTDRETREMRETRVK